MPNLSELRPRLTVIGVGGAGCNAVNNMIATGLSGVDFIVANTDAQALAAASTDLRIQLGAALTEGLGAGSRPEIGEAAAEEAIEDIREHIKGSHMVFIAAGMGGGTGTGAASVIARAARELGILTVGVVTKPFLFEGVRRMRIAEAGVAELRNYVDTLIVIPNQNLFRIASENTTFAEAFVMADQVLYSGVACIVDLIVKEGLINLDFADVRTVMTGMGTAMMGTGEAVGERRATVAAEEAISNPLLDDVSLRGAKGLLLSITGGPSLTLYEVDEAASRVRQEVDPEANIIVGATYDHGLGDRIRVSIVASGMSRVGEVERRPPAPADDWIRGSAARAPQLPPQIPAQAPADPARRQAAAQPQFAPEQRDYRGGAHDLQQRLTEALQYPAQAFGVKSQQGRGAEREPWRGPGNVTIEDSPPQLQGATPPPLPPGYAQAYPQAPVDNFAPQAPAEVRRYGRRLPESPEGHSQPPPQAAQPAYWEGDEYAQAPASRPPEQPQQRAEQPRRRLGLFERITGRVRGAGDSSASRNSLPEAYGQQGRTPHAPEAHGRGYEHDPHQQSSSAEVQQDVELPVFFRERRR
jgi:cell division protein FtsZ